MRATRTRLFRRGLIAAVLLLLPFSRATAAVVGTGTGTWWIELATGAITGELVFDSVPRDLFGMPVDLGTEVGRMTFVPPSAVLEPRVFINRLESLSPGVLSLESSGRIQVSLSGSAISTGTVELVAGSLAATWPSDILLRGESAFLCCSGAHCSPAVPSGFERCDATSLALNAFQAVPTPESAVPSSLDLETSFFHVARQEELDLEVDVRFDSVVAAGTTTLYAYVVAPELLPPEAAVEIGGLPATFFGLSTTAEHGGTVEVCAGFPDVDGDGYVDGTSVPEQSLALAHREASTFVWTGERRIEYAENRICGRVQALSEFVVAVDRRRLGAPGRCAPAPRTDCREQVGSQVGVFRFSRSVLARKNRLTWSWSKGEATSSAELGSPTTDTAYALCVYDGTPTAQPRLEIRVPAGGGCGVRDLPCWRALGGSDSGFLYFDPFAVQGGIERILLMPSHVDGRARIRLLGTGPLLALPQDPFEGAVIVQLQGDPGTCFSAIYDAHIRRNEPGLFHAAGGS